MDPAGHEGQTEKGITMEKQQIRRDDGRVRTVLKTAGKWVVGCVVGGTIREGVRYLWETLIQQ
jgi:hypothetical protein